MSETLDSDAREAEELAAAVEFDISEIDEEELAALPNFGDESELAVEMSLATNSESSDEAHTGAGASSVGGLSESAPKSRGPAWLDHVLTQLDRPLATWSPSVRRWIGLVAAVTVATSVLISILKPLLFSRRDLVEELRSSVARIEAGQRPSR